MLCWFWSHYDGWEIRETLNIELHINKHWVFLVTLFVCLFFGLPFHGGSEVKASACICGRPGFDPWVGMIPWRRKWQLTPVFLPGESHGLRSLVDYSPQGCKELDTTEQLHFSCTKCLLKFSIGKRAQLFLELWSLIPFYPLKEWYSIR